MLHTSNAMTFSKRTVWKSPPVAVHCHECRLSHHIVCRQDLKKPIVDDGLTVLVNTVVIPHTGLDRGTEDMKTQDVVYWSTVFRNGSGVLRSVSDFIKIMLSTNLNILVLTVDESINHKITLYDLHCRYNVVFIHTHTYLKLFLLLLFFIYFYYLA